MCLQHILPPCEDVFHRKHVTGAVESACTSANPPYNRKPKAGADTQDKNDKSWLREKTYNQVEISCHTTSKE